MPRIGRPPKARKNYISDAKVLIHISQAISMDNSLPDDWKEEITGTLNRLATKLLLAPSDKKKEEK